MSPLIITKGKIDRSLLGLNVKEGPPGARWTFQSNAWTEDVLGLEWFKNIFLPVCGQERPQLLILDGHHSHETLTLLELAKAENITTLCLPAHTSAYLQPLDRTVFRPFKLRYNEAVDNFLAESPFNLVTKGSWPALLRKAYEAGITPSNLTAGFRACGIFPWNPLAVPSYAFDGSNLFDIPSLLPNHQPGEHPLTWVLRRVVAGTEQINNDDDAGDVMVDDGDHLVAEIEIPYAPDQTVVDLPILAEPLPSTSSAWTTQIIEEFLPLSNSEKKKTKQKPPIATQSINK